MKSHSEIDSYIESFPEEVQTILQTVRQTIHKAAPEATEAISYGIPTFKLNGNVIHFAAFKNHIGVYPTPSGVEAFKEELSAYKNAKGSVQFQINKPMPLELITRIVEYRVKKNNEKQKPKKASSK